MNDTRREFNRDFFSGVIIITLFLIAYTFVPFLGIIITLFTPLPILFYYQKLGRLPCILVSLIASIIAVYFMRYFQSQFGIFFIIAFGIIGFTLSEVIQRNLSIEKTILYSVLIIIGAGVIFAYFFALVNVFNPWAFLTQHINEKVNQTARLYQELGISPEQIDSLRASTQSLANFIVMTFPSFTVVATAFVIWANILLAKRFYKTRNLKFPEFGDLSMWEAPDILVWGVIVGGLLLLSGGIIIKAVGLNVLIIFLCVFFFQGIAIVSYFFHKKKIPPILRGVGYLLIAIQQIFLFIVIGLGLIDVWADFRKLKKQSLSE